MTSRLAYGKNRNVVAAGHTEADLKVPAYILDRALGSLSVSAADEPASCPQETSKGKNSWDNAGISSSAC